MTVDEARHEGATGLLDRSGARLQLSAGTHCRDLPIAQLYEAIVYDVARHGQHPAC